MASQLSDHELIQQAKAGSRAASELLIRRHERQVYYVCLSMTRDPEESLDLTQETLLRAFSKLDSYRGNGSFQSWLRQVANRTCLNWLRSRKRRREMEELTDMNTPSCAPNQEADLAQREASEWLESEMQHLNDREQFAVRMRYFEQAPIRDLAAAMDCSEGTVKSMLFRSLQKLRDRMTPQLRHE